MIDKLYYIQIFLIIPLFKLHKIIFSTLVFNNSSIINIINIFSTIVIELNLTNIIISNKIIIMKNNLFNIKIIYQSIF